jgi:MFS family permease
VPERVESPIRRDLRASCVDGAMFSVMVGAGETYFAAFALALGVDKVTAGLVATVPMLFGAALQLVSPWAVARLGSNGRWVVATAWAQAAVFVPLAAAAFVGRVPTWLLFAIVSVYFAAGFASGPAWTTWIETLVPTRITSRYFAKRTVWAFVALLTALLLTGALLDLGDHAGLPLIAFADAFVVAGAARVVSAKCLAAQREPVPKPTGERHLSMTEVLRGDAHRPARRLVVYLLAMYMAVQIAQPFVTSYLLDELRLPYATFAALLGVPFLARILALPWLGRVAQRLGARRLMWIGAAAFVPAGAMWAASTNVAWLVVVQAMTGLAFAAFELANLLLWFETIRPEERTSMLTTYQFWYATAVVTGSVVGSVILARLGEGRSAFVVLFLVSAGARLVAAALFARTRHARHGGFRGPSPKAAERGVAGRR